ncbi:hypothetical protein NT1RE_17040 [Agrobacterium fabrum]|uniref:hypothetical protein n=1 Tax=Agrobacterium fabrum TaxID=1176649 RepID=UPI0002EE2FDF|nr:hypothetical protein [Agrobacterium fabrum]KJX86561.1 hypothetical protein SY94_3655 [Agrobacterium tumefaciens]MCX2875503.1 hypothetical protein [Agrobacterium fabrum]NMV69864.1 hypothetical protein [Agrobacterium fabrum]NSZ13537.1 hypothetical protein [Agrobacterium fabrum]QQN07788.1 hypothetical protein EML4058_16975 [Agrobacterium fabrum]
MIVGALSKIDAAKRTINKGIESDLNKRFGLMPSICAERDDDFLVLAVINEPEID